MNNIGAPNSDDRPRSGRRGWIDVRRSRAPKARAKLLGTGALFSTVMAAATSVMLLRTNEPIACERSQPLMIAATPAIAPTIQAIISHDVQLPCIEIRVVAQTAVETAEAIAVADGELPALWIPDSALWPRRAAQQAARFAGTPSIEQRELLAISPLVVVTTGMNGAGFGWPDAPPVGWQDLVGDQARGLATTISNPLSTTEGLTALAAVHGLVSAPKPELVGTISQFGRNAAPSIQSAYDRLGSGGEPLAFIATEQSIVSHNRGGASVPAVAVYPKEGTVALEYPLVRVIEPDEPPSLAELADRIERALHTPAATSSLLAAGFRSPQGDLDPSIATSLGVPPGRPALLPSPTAEQAADVLRTWNAVTLDSRMLVVIDTSSSMDAAAGNGRSRIELTRDVAIAALSLFPDTTSIGLWAFSTGKAPPHDWVELVSLGPLSGSTDPAGLGTRRQALLDAAQSLPSRTGGGAALNDTALAAFRSLRDSYEAGKVNSVVLFTDGGNEDQGGIDPATLIRTLRAENDPATPVPIITIGLGPDAGFEALQEISAATGGKAYLAHDPDNIRGVFLDALTLRQCRPAC